MKLVSLIYVLVLVACSGNSSRREASPNHVNFISENQEFVYDEQWPFEKTLKQSDPYISELLRAID